MSENASQLLVSASRGDEGAAERLTPLLYDELRRLAGRYVGQGRASVQPTSLVHEAYVRLVGRASVDFAGRTHFLAASAVAMRCVLVDRARARRAAKRGGEWQRITLDRAVSLHKQQDVGILELEEALSRLAELNGRAAKVVELRFFAGMSVEEVAHFLGTSERTVKRVWRMARAWLRTALTEPDQ